MSSPPSISVVVPSYNHAPFVAACLRSIFRQTHAPGELVVIDDGSRDDSLAIIERTLKDCPFPCELIARENRGLSRTLNESLARTAGDYFAYLGSDDLWLPEFLAWRVTTLEARADAVLAYGNAYSIDAHDRIDDCTTEWAAYTDGDARRMLLTTLAPLSPTVVYRRRALERYGWNEASRLEDYELYLQLSCDGAFAFDPRVLSAWRRHASNTSRDLRMMMTERLAAQTRVASRLGVSADELDRMNALAGFRSAQEFVRVGDKRAALCLTWENRRGIPSPAAFARMTAGIVLPHRLMRWHKERMRRAARRRYGDLRVDRQS